MKSKSIMKRFFLITSSVFFGNLLLFGQKDSVYFPIEKVIINKVFSDKNKTLHTQSTDWLNHDAGSFLTILPEFSGVRKSGNSSTDPVFRGFKYEQINIISDGAQTVMQACPSRMDPPISQINMNQVKKVEIYKGPYFFRYGAALGATINFVTEAPEFSNQTKLNGRLSTAYESNGNITRNEALLQIKSKRFTSQFSGAYQKGEDYKDGDGNLVPAHFERYNFSNKSVFLWNRYNYSTVQITTNQGRNTDFPALAMDMIYDKTWMFQLMHHTQFHHSFLKEFNFNSYASTVRHSMGTQNLSMISDVSSGTFGGRGELKFEKGNQTFYSGLDYKNESAKNTALIMMMPMGMPMKRDGTSWQNSEIFQIGWFNEYQFNWDKTRLRLSYRMDYNQANASEMSSLFAQLYGNVKSDNLNHNLSAGLERQIGSASKLSLWLGRAQRSASLTERFINKFPVGNDNYEYVGNPLLKPETNNQTDLIYTFGNQRKIGFQVNVFYALMQNYITGIVRKDIMPSSMKVPGVRQFQNINQAVKTGFESQVNYQISKNLRSEMSVAYTYAEDFDTKMPLPEIAPLDFRWNVMGDFNDFSFAVNYRFVARQMRINPNFNELPTPDFSLIDLHFGYQIKDFGRFQITINNAFNRTYSEYLNRTLYQNNSKRITMPGRSFGVAYSYKF